MLRKIKKSIKYLIIMFGIIMMVPTVLYLLLQTASVQTFLVRQITQHFSNELKSTISVGSVEYRFFNRLNLNKVLVKDQNNDTLLYSSEIRAGIRKLNFKSKSFSLGKINLINPVISLITDSTGQMNLTWFLNQLGNPSDTVKKAPGSFSIAQIDITNGRFSLINRNGNKGKTAIDFNNLHLLNLNGIVEDLRIENDSTKFNLYNLAFRESSGFTLNKMNGSVIISGHDFALNSGLISCDNTVLNIPHFALKADSANGFKNFTENVRLDLELEKSLISTTDLKYFIVLPDSLDESVRLSGKIMGTISELRGRKIMLSYRNFTTTRL